MSRHVISVTVRDRPGVLVAEISPELVVETRGRVPSLANARGFSPPAPLQS